MLNVLSAGNGEALAWIFIIAFALLALLASMKIGLIAGLILGLLKIERKLSAIITLVIIIMTMGSFIFYLPLLFSLKIIGINMIGWVIGRYIGDGIASFIGFNGFEVQLPNGGLGGTYQNEIDELKQAAIARASAPTGGSSTFGKR